MPLIASLGGATRGPSVGKPVQPAKPAVPISMMPKAQGLGLLPGMPGSGSTLKPSPAAGGAAGGGGASSIVPPLDQLAMANIAAYLNKTGTGVANDQASITSDQVALQNALSQDRQANQLANLKLMTGDNAAGGFYGSAYGQQLGNQNQAYGNKELAATSNTNLAIGKLQNAIAQGLASEPLYKDQQAYGSAQRASAAAAKMAPAALTPAGATIVPNAAPGRSPVVLGLAQRVARARGLAANQQLTRRGTPMGGLR